MKEQAHRGWYFTKSIVDDDFEVEGNILAWGKGRQGEPQTFPRAVHVPHWKSKAEPSLKIEAYTEWFEGQWAAQNQANPLIAGLVMACENRDWDTWKLLVEQAKGIDADMANYLSDVGK